MTSDLQELPECTVKPVGRADWKRFTLFLAAAVVAILAVVAAIAMFGDRLPLLTEEQLEAAIERWDESDIESYVADLEISGQRAGNVRVEVENGVATVVTRDNRPLYERRTRDVWSVPGQFDMMRRGLEIANDPVAQMQLRKGTQVVVRGKFDRDLGYPVAFSQVTLGGGTEFGWKTVRFERR